MEETEKTIQTTVYLPEDDYQKLRKLAFETHESQAKHIRQAVAWYLQHEIHKKFKE